MQSYGVLAFLPPLLAILMALVTKEVLSSLLTGILIGSVILHGSSAITHLLNTYIIKVGIADNAKWVLTMLLIGGLLGVIQVSGGFTAFGDWAEKRVKTRNGAQVAAWVAGIIVFLSPSLNALTVGTVMRPLTDKFRVSREKLAFIVDSTGAPVSALAPISTWVPYLAAFITQNAKTADGMAEVLRAIPFNFYAWASVVLTGLIAAGILPDWGPMRRAEERALKTGELIRLGSRPLSSDELDQVQEATSSPRFMNFAIPIGSIFVVAIWTFVTRKAVDMVLGFSVAVVVSLALYTSQRLMRPKRFLDEFIRGAKSILPAALILVLAFALSAVCKDLGLATYVVEVSQGVFSPRLLPFLTFVVASVISIPTGTSFGTMAILFPVVLPLAVAMGAPLSVTVGALVGGSAFGDHISPVSDTTILSSMSSGCDHVDHVVTQTPYGAACAAISLIAYLVIGLL